MEHDGAAESFERFLAQVEAPLRRSLIARFGLEDGRDAAAHAVGYGWEHWDRVSAMDNPGGYLYRVGQTWGRRRGRRYPFLPVPPDDRQPWVEPTLPRALARLPHKQRVAVLLRFGSDWTVDEIARFTGSTPAAVRKQVERALTRLRRSLEVNVDV